MKEEENMRRPFLILALCLASLVLTSCGGGDGRPEMKATSEGQVSQVEAVRPVDLDLTKLSGTVVYSQVYDMVAQPEAYLGQRIKMKGSFSYFKDPDTQQEYFAAVIADATACCAQGIEFVWKGEHTYPLDYPPPDAEITVTGTFSPYYEDDYMYVRLIDADVTWQGQ